MRLDGPPGPAAGRRAAVHRLAQGGPGPSSRRLAGYIHRGHAQDLGQSLPPDPELETLKEMLQDEWAEDKEQFGTAGHDYLLHDEYAMSMYELIDNWCGKVESLSLYQKLLQLIFDSMTTVEKPKLKKKASSLFGSTRSLRKKKGKGGAMLAGAVTAAVAAHDEPSVVLKPVRLIEVRYQQLMDMRHMAVKEVVKIQKGSRLSQAQTADRRNKGKSRL